MKFGPVTLQQAQGKILAHNLSDSRGKRRIRKGTVLQAEHIGMLMEIGLETVYVAELEAHDVSEEQAAPIIAASLSGDDIELQGAVSGRTNLLAAQPGLVHIDQVRLNQVNQIPGITVATLPQWRVVSERETLASVKIIPHALPKAALDEIEEITGGSGSVITLRRLLPKKVALMLTGMPGLQGRLERDFKPPLTERIEALGSKLAAVAYLSTRLPQIVDQLAGQLKIWLGEGYDMIMLAGETAIMDERDITPQAVIQAGGVIECVGAPVDPGNLLLLGYLENTPVIGVPGCARSMKENVVDWIVPRLLSGERLSRVDVLSLGVGGLLEDIHDRPLRRRAQGDRDA